MRVLAIVHEADAGPGVFREVVRARGYELHEWEIAADHRCPEAPESYGAVVSFGGSMHAGEHEQHPWLAQEERLLARLLEHGRPVLGVCLGAQILARAGGAATARLARPEIGWHLVTLGPEGRVDPLLGPLGWTFESLQWHSCEFNLPPAAHPLATSAQCLQAYRGGELAWGIQFHAEVTLDNFEAWIDRHLAKSSDERPEDPEALRDRTRKLIAGWNALGRGLFGRFLDQAAVALDATTAGG